MYCAFCGARLTHSGRFCVGCGAARELPVPSGEPLADARRLAAAGLPGRAAELLRAAVGRTPADRALRLALAAVLLQGGHWSAGLGELERLRQEGPFDPTVEAYRGGALLEMGRIGEAKEVLDAARARAPGHSLAALKRGELFCRLGIHPTAVQELECALALGLPDDETVRVARRLVAVARERSKRGFVRRLAGALSRSRRAEPAEAVGMV